MTAIPDQQRSRRDLAFPPPLQDAEEAILCRKPGRYPGGPRVGVGLSGGGIRSATFCLGAMQWIAGRGRWTNEPFDEPSLKTRRRPRQVLDPPDRRRFSRAHAALARICYDGSPRPGSWLLYIKATLTGDEPADLLEYHANHPDFPHQTTADQFFDEAQWESYRRLGEHILEKLLPEHSRLEDLLGLVPRSP